MVCKWCGGDVDDPFWDDECPECQHELYHNTGAGFEPSCGDCCSSQADVVRTLMVRGIEAAVLAGILKLGPA